MRPFQTVSTGEQAMHIMQRLNGQTGTAFVFATHDPHMVAFERRMVKLRDGRTAENGMVRDLSAT
jgi:putative ABC transport system ATP-binding protein